MTRSTPRWIATAVVGAMLAAGASPAFGDDIDDRRAAVERQQSSAESDREELAHELEGTDAALAEAVLELHDIEAQLPGAEVELAAAEAEVERTRREAEQLAQRLEDAEGEEDQITEEIDRSATEVDGARADLAEMARRAYRGEGSLSSLGIVTGAQSSEEFVDEYAAASSAARSTSQTLDDLRDAESIARNRSARLEAIRETIADLKAQADQNVIDAETARQAAADRKAELDRLQAEQQEKKSEIESQKAQAEADLAAVEEQQSSLEADLQAVVAEQIARDKRIQAEKAAAEKAAAEEAARRAAEAAKDKPSSSGSSSSGSSSSGSSSSGSGSSGGGSSSSGGGSSSSASWGLSWPTAVPHITSRYGMRVHPFLPGVTRLHAGLDLRAYCGTPIYAAQSGTVLYSRWYGGLGQQVLVNHGVHGGNSVMSSYNHLSVRSVSAGQKVSKGQLLGYSGTTGTSQVCHLHFEVYRNGSTVDPLTYL